MPDSNLLVDTNLVDAEAAPAALAKEAAMAVAREAEGLVAV